MTAPIDLTTMKQASGLYGDQPAALQSVRDRLLIVLAQNNPTLSMLTGTGREGMPYTVLALHALDDVEGAVELLGYHWYEPDLLTDPVLAAWAATATPGELRPFAGRRYPEDLATLSDATRSQFEPPNTSTWQNLLLADYVRRPLPHDPRMVNWTDPARMAVTLQDLSYESAASRDGSYTYTIEYGRAEDLIDGAWVEGAQLIARTDKLYTGAAAGPGLRMMRHYLYRSEGEPLEWETLPAKAYAPALQKSKGTKRREIAMDTLATQLAGSVEQAGADSAEVFLQLQQPIQAFVQAGKPRYLVDALAADANFSSLAPTVEAALDPWFPPEVPE